MGLFTNPLSHAGYPPNVTGTPTTQPSEVRAATITEANDGILDNVYISPATAQAAAVVDFASPPAGGFGSVTPRPVHATTLDSTSTTSLGTAAASVVNVGVATSTIGFFGATAVAKPASTDDLKTALVNLGLYTTGGATPLNLGGGTLTSGDLTAVGTVNINTSGAGITSIGTGGTGATNIGNATGNTAITGTLTAPTIHGTAIDTNVAAAQLSLSGNTLDATGTDANVGLNITTKNTGSIVFAQSKAGVDQNLQITNGDNTAVSSNAGIQLAVGGSTSLGDPYVRFEISGVGASTMSMGLDNSDSDKFVISNSNALGTANALTLTQAGALTATTSITATAGNITATNGNIVRGAEGNKDVYLNVAAGTAAGGNSAGQVTLVGGTATVSTTAVNALSFIRLTRQSIGATGANPLGLLSIGTIVASTSFVINALSAADATALVASDVSIIAWEIVN